MRFGSGKSGSLPAVLAAVGWLALATVAAHGQAPAAPSASDSMSSRSGSSDSGPPDTDTSVGYIDSAVPRSQLRLRFDDAFRNNVPSRGEFFYAKSGFFRALPPGQGGDPHASGPPLPETNVDYQEFNASLEWALDAHFSVFVEAPERFLNPDFNRNDSGFGDVNAGFKWAFLWTEDWLASFQFRTYTPTGAANRGLGTDHVSLEPALLVNHRLTDLLTLEGELRYWIPIGGTDFAGDVVRYGLGVSFGERNDETVWFTPVAELVGWTLLDGKDFSPVNHGGMIHDAGGETIVNAKVGVRVGYADKGDLYIGYGRALTGDFWYKNIVRVELRWFF